MPHDPTPLVVSRKRGCTSCGCKEPQSLERTLEIAQPRVRELLSHLTMKRSLDAAVRRAVSPILVVVVEIVFLWILLPRFVVRMGKFAQKVMSAALMEMSLLDVVIQRRTALRTSHS